MKAKENKKLGVWMATSLVLGNMIGSGIFLLPSVLAPYGGISILGWLLTTCGAMAFALVFSQLSQAYPTTGGLYVYCKQEFGEAIGFLLAWCYWISICIGTAAIVTSFTSYSGYFLPGLTNNGVFAAAFSLITLWILTLINASSVYSGGILQLITTIFKILPIALISLFGLVKLDVNNFVPFNPSEISNPSALLTTAAITLWAFLGLECASIPAGSIENPKRTIPLATILGTLIASVVYIISTTAIMGLINPTILAKSNAPFTDAAHILWGNTGSLIIGIGSIIACLGAVNGWILVQGQMAFAIANDHLLPKFFRKQSKHGAPYASLIMSSIITSLIILMNYSDSLITMFRFIFELSTVTTLTAFLFCAIARILLANKTKSSSHKKTSSIAIASFAFGYGMLALAYFNEEIIYWTLIALLLGLPVYAWIKAKIK